MIEAIDLRLESLDLTLYPEIGGSVGRFRWRHPEGRWVDLLRPTDRGAIAALNSAGVACYPLTPFSNRVRNGRFSFAGQSYVLPLNTDGPHAQHGHGWQRAWAMLSRDDACASIGFTHDPRCDQTWPFAYQAWQDFSLSEDGLSITIGARNLDSRAMPIGLGLHPYFLRTPGCRLTADVDGFWEVDREVMPVSHRDVPRALDLRPGLVMHDVVIDNVFTGFAGEALITWPEHGAKLRLRAGPQLPFLVVYSPDASSIAAEAARGVPAYFCAEPVSNITDAFNLAHVAPPVKTGLIVLPPGGETSATVTMQVESF